MKKLALALSVCICVLILLSCALTVDDAIFQKEKITVVAASPSITAEIINATPSPVSTPMPTPTQVEETPEPKPQYGFTEEEVYLLAQLLCGSGAKDGDGEYDIDFRNEINYFEISKVLCVVMNRVCSDSFPNTVTDVIMQTGQFSVMPNNANKIPSDIAIQTVQDWCDAYDRFDDGAISIPENHLYFTGNGTTNTTRASY